MRNIYIEPKANIFKLDMESLLNNPSGIPNDAQGQWGGSAKNNDFSSWDYDFDEEEESESNFSSKSLWD